LRTPGPEEPGKVSQSPDLDRIKSYFQMSRRGEESPYVEFRQDAQKMSLPAESARPRPLSPPVRTPPRQPVTPVPVPPSSDELPALDRAIGKSRPTIVQTEKRWPAVLITGPAGGTGKTLLLASMAAQWALMGRSVIVLDLSPSSFLSFLFLGQQKTETARAGKIWTSFFMNGEKIPLLSVRMDPPFYSRSGTDLAFTDLYHEIRKEAPALYSFPHHPTPVILLDLPMANRSLFEEAVDFGPLVIAPLIPEIPSLLAAKEMENFFDRAEAEKGIYCERYYIINRLHHGNSFHNHLAGRFDWLLNTRLCPLSIPENPALETLLAKGENFLGIQSDIEFPAVFEQVSRWVLDRLDLQVRTGSARTG
jgi:cellulose biosynthesis protein BcsQ